MEKEHVMVCSNSNVLKKRMTKLMKLSTFWFQIGIQDVESKT
jgi:hypothetical protein